MSSLPSWLIWSLFSALFAAATAILAKVGVKDIDSNIATAVRTTVILVFTWAIAIALGQHNAIRQISPRAWLFLALSGIATGLSWLCYFRALQLGEASRVAPIDKLSVVLVIIFAAIFLGESLTPLKLLGGALIAGGAVILALA
jgi:transporter family protein